jgi:hypothetical protein
VKIEHFEDIEGWKLGRKLANLIYSFTERTPFAKDFGLRDQIQRAAGSVMHNIAEGFDAGSNPEFARFLGFSKRKPQSAALYVTCKATPNPEQRTLNFELDYL